MIINAKISIISLIFIIKFLFESNLKNININQNLYSILFAKLIDLIDVLTLSSCWKFLKFTPLSPLSFTPTFSILDPLNVYFFIPRFNLAIILDDNP